MLRKNIHSIVSSVDDPNEAAKLICYHLDYELGLSGNGWFDDDPEMEPIFCGNGDQERVRLKTAVKKILNKQGE